MQTSPKYIYDHVDGCYGWLFRMNALKLLNQKHVPSEYSAEAGVLTRQEIFRNYVFLSYSSFIGYTMGQLYPIWGKWSRKKKSKTRPHGQ